MLPGFFSVIHTFWADTKRNPHIHTVCTTWWIHKDNWSRIELTDLFIPYKSLNSRRKYNLSHQILLFLKNKSPADYDRYKLLLNQLYQKERYIRCEPKVSVITKVISYVARYFYRPPFSETRIESYNGEYLTFRYEHKQPKETRYTTFSAIEFILNVFRHLHDKHFASVRYGWIFATACKKKYLQNLHLIVSFSNKSSKLPFIALTYRQRHYQSFWSDPLICPHCACSLFCISITIGSYYDTS